MSKKFIAFLGTNNYAEVHYIHNDMDMEGYTSKFIQEVLVKTVCKDWNNFDKAVIFITEEAKKLNWYNEKDKNRRLKVLLENTQLDSEDVLIPSGKDEREIWEIFHIVTSDIEEGDKIVLDITHAFRYIPMLATIILDYTKAVKNIEILGIYYGAWDMRNQSVTPNIAPIFNLTPLMVVQEWSQAVNTFIKYGNSGHLKKISRTGLKPKLSQENWARETNKFINRVNDFAMNINICRGQMVQERRANQKSIQLSTKEIRKSLSDVKKLDTDFQLKPLIPLISKIEESVESFDENSTLNTGLATIEWCIKNHLIQQAYTALEETLKTYVCELHGLDANEYKNREDIVNTAINRRIQELSGKGIEKTEEEKDGGKLCKVMDNISNSLDTEFVSLANNIKIKRNDINHFGFSRDVATYGDLEKDIKEYYHDFLRIINKNPAEELKKEEKIRQMILIFSHKLTEIQVKDAKFNLKVKKFIYLSDELQNIWSNIDPHEECIKDKLRGIFKWIEKNANRGDYVLIHGDLGATYQLVEYCKAKGLRPIYSTTKREAIERRKDDNSLMLGHKVPHVRYREY